MLGGWTILILRSQMEYFVVHAPAEGGVLRRTIDRLSRARGKRSAIIRARVHSSAPFV